MSRIAAAPPSASRFARLQPSRGSCATTSCPRASSSATTPRRKCALPWFQSETIEWQKIATLIARTGVRGPRPLVSSNGALSCVHRLAPPRAQPLVHADVAGGHRRRLLARRPPPRPLREAAPQLVVADDPLAGGCQCVRVAGRDEERVAVPQLAQRRDVAEHERAARQRR